MEQIFGTDQLMPILIWGAIVLGISFLSLHMLNSRRDLSFLSFLNRKNLQLTINGLGVVFSIITIIRHFNILKLDGSQSKIFDFFLFRSDFFFLFGVLILVAHFLELADDTDLAPEFFQAQAVFAIPLIFIFDYAAGIVKYLVNHPAEKIIDYL